MGMAVGSEYSSLFDDGHKALFVGAGIACRTVSTAAFVIYAPFTATLSTATIPHLVG